MPGDTETVNVPHTWNIGKYDDYEGTAWYFRTFEADEALLRNTSRFISAPRSIAPGSGSTASNSDPTRAVTPSITSTSACI